MPLPSGLKVEIEFVVGSNTWVDVTVDVDWDKGVALKFGRSSEFSAPQTATCVFTLNDPVGNYTARNAASTYYPNIRPRRRVRVSNSAGVRFLGYIKGWPPGYDGTRRVVVINATDRTDLLSRVTLLSSPMQEIAASSPTWYFPLSDAGSSSQAGGLYIGEYLGRLAPAPYVYGGATGGTVSGGKTQNSWDTNWTTLASSGGTGAGGFAGLVGAGGTGAALTGATWSLCVAFQFTSTGGLTGMVALSQSEASSVPGSGEYLNIDWALGIQFNYRTSATTNGIAISTTASFHDTNVHVAHIVGTGSDVLVYVDGVLQVGGNGGAAAALTNAGWTTIGAAQFGVGTGLAGIYGWSNGSLGHVALWQGVALTAGQVAGQAQAILTGFAGTTTGAAITRILGYAGVTAGGINAMTGKAIIAGYPQAGKTPTAAAQELVTTEGGGAAAYVDTDGRYRFNDRTYRNAAFAGAVNLDAVLDVDGTKYQPLFDELTLVNDSTVTRNATGNTFRYQDTASITEFQDTTDTATTFANTDQDALNLAQDRVVRQSQPAIRAQLAIDAVTANGLFSYAALQTVTIGTHLILLNIPKSETIGTGAVVVRSGVGQLDFFVEGWTETLSPTSYPIVFDTSPANAPALMKWDDSSFGHWRETPNTITLSATINASVTSLVAVIAASNPIFTTAVSFNIQIDEEIMQVTAVVGGASPQTLTVVRGSQSTTAAAHTAGARITLWPRSTWTL